MSDRSRTAPTRSGPRILEGVLAVGLLCLPSGCEFFEGPKDVLGGTGPRAMDPYAGRPSGAIRLGLQLYNGCGVLADGSNTGKGSLGALDAGVTFTYPYPATCADLNGVTRPAAARQPMPIIAGVPYFLDQLTIAEVVRNRHTDPKNLVAPLDWITKETCFKNLDWSDVGVDSDEWSAARAPTVGGATRVVLFSGAAWMAEKHDSFLVEILDASGGVVASMDYPRDSFALTTAMGGHTQFSYQYGTVGRPEFVGDTRINPVPTQPVGGATVPAPSFRTMARLDLVTQVAPHERAFTLPEGLRGDGVARVTWSLLPDEPFYFPLTFTHPTEPAYPQCWSASDPSERAPCDFGVDPQVTFTAPENGRFYAAGETLQMIVKIADGLGNLLHPPDALPSYNEYLAGRSNGLLYNFNGNNGTFGERNVWSSMSVQGPINKMKGSNEGGVAWFSQFGRGSLPSAAATGNSRSGARDIPGETRWPIALPADAKSGTYVAMVKANRQFMGERVTRTNAFYFQVGQLTPTKYPEKVGNCYICHRGPTSLTNLAMGMASEDVEACKSCHDGGSIARVVHNIHMTSVRYPMKKNDCSVCHLLRESALEASLVNCNGCHMQAHAGQFFSQLLAADAEAPNAQSACGPACHTATPPTQHILPPTRGNQ